MKKLPFCTLCAGALFVVIGTIALLRLAPSPDLFGMLFPLLWDLAMVGIGLGIILRCECARKAGIVWSIFCIIATLVVGGATIFWTLSQNGGAIGRDRLAFIGVTIAFGVLFGLWQLIVLRSPASREWTEPTRESDREVRHS